jgi:hypothetical protein
VDSVPDPLHLRKSGNRTRTSGSVASKSDHCTTEAVNPTTVWEFDNSTYSLPTFLCILLLICVQVSRTCSVGEEVDLPRHNVYRYMLTFLMSNDDNFMICGGTWHLAEICCSCPKVVYFAFMRHLGCDQKTGLILSSQSQSEGQSSALRASNPFLGCLTRQPASALFTATNGWNYITPFTDKLACYSLPIKPCYWDQMSNPNAFDWWEYFTSWDRRTLT